MEIKWIDKTNMNKLTLLIVIFFFWGCASNDIMVHRDSILLDQNPIVFVRYEYDEVQLNVHLEVLEGNPTAYKLGVYNLGILFQ